MPVPYGHNRPHVFSRMPGTSLRVPGKVPQAVIYKPSRSATQSGPGRDVWVLEFEPAARRELDPLMGWTASRDPFQPIRLTFPDKESAIAHAEAQGWDYVVREPAAGRGRARPPAFAPGRRERAMGLSGPVRLRRAVEAPGAHWQPGHGPQSHTGEPAAIDPVLEADIESFPASDPPAWTGTSLP